MTVEPKRTLDMQMQIDCNRDMETLEQLEFSALVGLWPVIVKDSAVRHRRRVEAVDPSQYAVILLRATTEENIAFSTYAIMMAVHGHGEAPPSMAGISLQTGYSYWAVRNQVDRTPWFAKTHSDLVRLSLTDEAKIKLERITRRIARYA